jgi:type IV pilus assembly protein PilN
MERTAWVQKRLKELEEIKKKVDDYKARNAELERRIKLIQELEDNRNGPLFVMDSLSKSIPERSWIDKFTETGYSAKLEGIAWNEFTVSDFLKNLQASKYFGNVELKSIKKQIMQDLPLRSFVINASLNYSGKTKENVDTSKGKGVKEKG